MRTGERGTPLTWRSRALWCRGESHRACHDHHDLAMRRPYRLPFRDRLHFFSRAEFSRLFPARIVDHMTAHSHLLPDDQNVTGDLYYFPDPSNVSVVVAARMSLSFPGLIQAVPLYKCDHSCCLRRSSSAPAFASDGGLSEFPDHFFDRIGRTDHVAVAPIVFGQRHTTARRSVGEHGHRSREGQC